MAESNRPCPPGALPLDGGATVGRSQLGVGCVAAVAALLVVVFIVVGVIVAAAGLVEGSTAAIVLGGVFVALAIVTLVVLIRWMRRSRAWLEGTHLVVCGPLSRGRCDLATARVGIDSVPERTSVPISNPGGGVTSTSVPTGRRIPRLVVRDATTGQLIRLSLRMRGGGMLPGPQLRALADVISIGPRPQPDDQEVHQIAAALRELADDPLAGHL